MNQPLHVGRERLGDVIDLAIRGTHDPLTLKRIDREMERCLQQHAPNPEVFWLVLAFSAFLQGKTEECLRKVRAAVDLAPYDVAVLANSGTLLANIGEPRRAADLARRLAEVASTDGHQIAVSIQLLGMALCFEEGEEMMQKHARPEDAIAVPIQRLGEIARSRGIPVELRWSLLESAIEVLRVRGYAVRQTALRHYPDDALRYELFIDAGAEDCGELNFAIAETLIERFEDPHPELVTFACRPLSSYTFEASYKEVAR